MCGGRILASYQRLALLDKRNGSILMKDAQPGHNLFISSKIAVENHTAFMAGPRGVYSFDCD